MMSSRLVYSALVCSLLSACGGGGGGGGGGSSSGGGGTGSPVANSAPVLAAVGDQQVFEGTDSVITTLFRAPTLMRLITRCISITMVMATAHI
jgi:hypothetical protein